jgi:hypothetical protein
MSELVLSCQHLPEQFVLALEMMVERALCEPRFGRDVVHRDPTVAPAAEKPVGPIENLFPRLFGGTRHGKPSVKVYPIVNLQRPRPA